MALPAKIIVFFLLGLGSTPVLQASQTLRIGTNVWPGYYPLYIAADRDEWEQNLDVRLVHYPSASEVLRAFRNQVLEAAALTLDEVLTLLETGLPLKVVAVLDISDGGDVILGKPGLNRFEDLRGCRIGVESGALGAYFITRALEINNMTLDDIEVVHLDVSAQESAYKANNVDAVVTFGTAKTNLLAAGAQELFSSGQIPGEIVNVLVVHETSLQAQPDKISDMIASWFRVIEFHRTQPAEAAKLISEQLGMSAAQVVESYAGLHHPNVKENQRLLDHTLNYTLVRLRDTLLSEGLLNSPFSVSGLLDSRLLPN